jgi:hypothetical protein
MSIWYIVLTYSSFSALLALNRNGAGGSFEQLARGGQHYGEWIDMGFLH